MAYRSTGASNDSSRSNFLDRVKSFLSTRNNPLVSRSSLEPPLPEEHERMVQYSTHYTGKHW